MASAKSSGRQSGGPGNLFSHPDLDKEKFAQERLKSKLTKKLRAVEDQLEWVHKQLQEKRERMSSYTSTFLVGGKVKQVEPDVDAGGKGSDAAGHTARFGRIGAVAGTKAIISKRAKQLETQIAVMKKNLNSQQSKNSGMQEEIDALRKGQEVYDSLFEKLQVELQDIQTRIADTKTSIGHMYAERATVRKEMQNLMDQVQGLQLESQLEWQVQDKALSEAEQIMHNPIKAQDLHAAVGGLSASEEQQLRDQQHEALSQIAADQLVVDKLESQTARYEAALAAVRDGTGFEDMQALVSTLQDFDREKFAKVQAVNRLVADIEAEERAVQAMKDSYLLEETHHNSVAQRRRTEVLALEDEACNLEAAVEETEHDIKSMLGDISVLRDPLHDLFSVLGCGDLFVVGETVTPTPSLDQDELSESKGEGESKKPVVESEPASPGGQAAASPSRNSPSSPSLSSSRMYMRSPLLRQSMQSGLSLANLEQFVSILGQRAADTLHRFAVVMAARTESGAHAVAQLAALAAVRSPADDEHSSVAQLTYASAKQAHQSLAAVGVQVGPDAPPGSQTQTLTRSALLAALVDTESAAKAAGPELDSRPLTRVELQATAAKALKSASLQAAVKASDHAAAYLAGHLAPGGSGERKQG